MTPNKHTYIYDSGYEDYLLGSEFIFKTLDKKHHLEVHHKFYIKGRLPWYYDSSDLVTLCNWCHFEFHQNNKVPIYIELRKIIEKYEICNRCNGLGWFSDYSHDQGGVCFKCGGKRYISD